MNELHAILKSKLEATAHIANRLAYSILQARTIVLDPLTLHHFLALSETESEFLDAYLFRFGTLVSNIQDSLFKSIGEIEQESVILMSNRDKTNLMERLQILPSAENFSAMVLIRNKLMHHYPRRSTKASGTYSIYYTYRTQSDRSM